jgi:tricorn protease
MRLRSGQWPLSLRARLQRRELEPSAAGAANQPGVNVKAGEYLLEVNGREVRPPANVYGFFEALVGKYVVLKVRIDASGAGAREVG